MKNKLMHWWDSKLHLVEKEWNACGARSTELSMLTTKAFQNRLPSRLTMWP